MPIEFEVCVTSLEGAIAAENAGATRIELCSSLECGGITPSYGLIKAVRQKLSIPVHVLVRPRAGDFIYSETELQIMHDDVAAAGNLQCAGVVIGALTDKHRVHIEATTRLVKFASSLRMTATFHRAFDDLEDQVRGLEGVIKCGCRRVLTSGGGISAADHDSVEQLKKLVELAGDRTIIMPGAGINPINVRAVVSETGAKAIHASCKKTIGAEEQHQSLFTQPQWVTDETIVRQMVQHLNT